MSSSEKVYVIDPAAKGEQRGKSTVLYTPAESAGRGGKAKRLVPRKPARDFAELDRLDEKGSPALAFFAYLAGPLSILATRRGRRSGFWIALACISFGAAVVFALRVEGVIPMSARFGTGSLLWLIGACLATIIGCAAWARGAFLVGRIKSPLLRRLPALIRHPGTVGVLGLVIPGFGLHVSGHPWRAAFALWSASLLAISAVILLNAPGLWAHSMNGGFLSLRPDDLEIAFLAIAAIGLFAAIAWIVQALDGMRLAGLGRDGESRDRGDLAALALVAAIAAFAGFFEPVDVARDLDRFAVSMHWEGMRLIPLQAASCAVRLDPSRPEYILHVIAMNESLDRFAEADALRDDLAVRWDAYARTLTMLP